MGIVNQKGQIALLDVFLACVLFILLFVAITALYNQRINELIELKKNDQLKESGSKAFDVLVKSYGIPENWSLSGNDANVIGLLQNSHTIDLQKWNALKNMDYGVAKQKLGLSSFEFNLELRNKNQFLIDEIGLDANTGNVLMLQRVMDYNNESVKVNFIVWK